MKQCEKCQQSRGSPPEAPLYPWPWPSHPWSRLHLDFAGPINNTMFLVVIDAHSKWIEVFPMSSATSSATIQRLRVLFAQFGLPDTVITDNGSCFVSQEFEAYLTENGVHHLTSAPYHPASNGMAERAVQIVKNGLKRDTEGTLTERLARVLFNYRIMPHSTTDVSPAELLFGRTLRSRLDLVRPDVSARVQSKQYLQKLSHDTHSHDRKFSVGEKVYFHNYSRGPRWLPGVVEKCSGPVSLIIKSADGQSIRRHIDQIRKRHSEVKESAAGEPELDLSVTIASPPDPDSTPNSSLGQAPKQDVSDHVSDSPHFPSDTSHPHSPYPSRIRHPPDRFTPVIH